MRILEQCHTVHISMARKRITIEDFDQLIEAYRMAPDNHLHAHQWTGIARATCKKAWERGYPAFYGGKSIKHLFEEEAKEARRRLLAEQALARSAAEQERIDARRQAIEARIEEGKMVGASRQSVLRMLQSTSGLAQVSNRMVQEAANLLAVEFARPPSERELGPTALVKLTERVAKLLKQTVDSAHEVMVMERLYLGQPTDIIGITSADDAMTMDEAELRIAAAIQAVQGARQKAGITVIDGGLAQNIIDIEEDIPRAHAKPLGRPITADEI